jgi:hypothetical protein
MNFNQIKYGRFKVFINGVLNSSVTRWIWGTSSTWTWGTTASWRWGS